MGDAWAEAGRETTTPPMPGRLSTVLPVYDEPTLDLRATVHAQPVGFRPHIRLEPTAHPLAVEQGRGITWDALAARVEVLMQQD
jgi:hypothetical protein